MKKNKFVIFMLIIILFLVNSTVVTALGEEELSANRNKSIDKENSVRVAKFMDQAPNELKEFFADENPVISPDWFDEKGNLLPLISLDTRYIETSTLIDANGVVRTIERELTAEEYADWTLPESTRAACTGSIPFGALCWETTAKKLLFSVLQYGANPGYRISVVNTWKTMPSVKSFDSIGVLFQGYNVKTAWGYQYYNTTSNANLQTINYSYKGTNMKISTANWQGIAISQDIVNNVHNTLRNELWVDGSFASSGAIRFTASYQHAVSNITLATSHNFSFNPSGMGKVFNWNPSWSTWDNMAGLCKNVTPSILWVC